MVVAGAVAAAAAAAATADSVAAVDSRLLLSHRYGSRVHFVRIRVRLAGIGA